VSLNRLKPLEFPLNTSSQILKCHILGARPCTKGQYLPYPDSAYELEFSYLFLYLLVEPPRLFLASKVRRCRLTLSNPR